MGMSSDSKPGMPQHLRFGLLGETLSYSLSPRIHRTIYDWLGIRARYEAIELPLKLWNPNRLSTALSCLDGFNVTLPYKERILPLLDEIDADAAAIGAVNTVCRMKGSGERVSLKGYNTDAYGFKATLETMGITAPKAAIVLGTGGSSKMAVHILKAMGAHSIDVVSRNPGAALMSPELSDSIRVISYEKLERRAPTADVLVNCTPVGMKHIYGGLPISKRLISRQSMIFDLIYSPAETPLLQVARHMGIPCTNGLRMLVTQAIYADRLWLPKPFGAAIRRSGCAEQTLLNQWIEGLTAQILTELPQVEVHRL